MTVNIMSHKNGSYVFLEELCIVGVPFLTLLHSSLADPGIE